MKSRLILTCAVVAVLIGLLACSPAPKQVSVNVPCDEFMKSHHISQQVEVAAGDSFTVTLCSNPTTGFQWESARISDQTVLQEMNREFIGPAEEPGKMPPPPGTAGQEVWTFQALKAGESTISIDYSRPWEGGEKGEWTYNLTVAVK